MDEDLEQENTDLIRVHSTGEILLILAEEWRKDPASVKRGPCPDEVREILKRLLREKRIEAYHICILSAFAHLMTTAVREGKVAGLFSILETYLHEPGDPT